MATVSITVNAVDDAPVAVDDAKTLDEDAAATTFDVLANDTDVDGGTKKIDSATAAGHGAVVVAGDGSSLTYGPAADYCGSDTFTYKLNGGSQATVSVTVTCVNDAPVAHDDTGHTTEAATLTVDAAHGVLANDSDVDGDTLTATKTTDPGHGTVTVAADGGYVYTPAAGFTGTDSFTYKANDGHADSSAATVTITVGADLDGDGILDDVDTDDDGDGVPDTQDAFPRDKNESVDTDGDGTGNNADADDDGDGVADAQDAFPLDKNETVDTDGDGVGNNADTDDDNDGVADAQDAFPLDNFESVDTDGDGTGNNADTDDDGDGVPDAQDAFPLDKNESRDADGDGIGDNADPHDDTLPPGTTPNDPVNPLAPTRLVLAHPTIRPSGKWVKVTLKCRAAAGKRCIGTLMLDAPAGKSKAAAKGKYGRLQFNVARNKDTVVKVKATSRLLKALKKRHRVAARATAVYLAADGSKSTVTRAIRIVEPKKKRR